MTAKGERLSKESMGLTAVSSSLGLSFSILRRLTKLLDGVSLLIRMT